MLLLSLQKVWLRSHQKETPVYAKNRRWSAQSPSVRNLWIKDIASRLKLQHVISGLVTNNKVEAANDCLRFILGFTALMLTLDKRWQIVIQKRRLHRSCSRLSELNHIVFPVSVSWLLILTAETFVFIFSLSLSPLAPNDFFAYCIFRRFYFYIFFFTSWYHEDYTNREHCPTSEQIDGHQIFSETSTWITPNEDHDDFMTHHYFPPILWCISHMLQKKKRRNVWRVLNMYSYNAFVRLTIVENVGFAGIGPLLFRLFIDSE